MIGMQLAYDAFAPGRSYPFLGDSIEPPDLQAHNLRQFLLALAARGLRPAFDLLLGGYYSEGMSLIRTSLESWARAVFLRLKPEEFGRWYVPPEQASPETIARWGYNRAEPGFASEIVTTVRDLGDNDDKTTMEDMEIRYRLMNQMMHPSGQTIRQIYDETDDMAYLGPTYTETFCRHGFNHGIFVQIAMLREIRQLGPQSAEWDTILQKLDWLFAPMNASMRPALEEEQRTMELIKQQAKFGPTMDQVKKARRIIAQREAMMNYMPLPSKS